MQDLMVEKASMTQIYMIFLRDIAYISKYIVTYKMTYRTESTLK